MKNLSTAKICTSLYLSFLVAAAIPSVAHADQPAPEPAAARFEVRFLDGMIDHHAMAVMMGEMCLEKAVHEELREMCANIVATQSQEIELMQGWLADWYGVAYEPEMKDSGQMRKLAELDGAEFEIAFMEMMIRHHEGAIREASRCVARAYHQELVDLCEQIIAVQSAEIEQMEIWLCEWYGECA
jgi:uncharacterized protein (DUF305 family)